MIENHHADDTEESTNLTELEPIATTKASVVWASGLPSDGIRLHFVPGGRFLLTAVVNSLRLWDVGPVGEERPLGSRIVSERALGGGYPTELVDLAAFIVDERKLRVAVATLSTEREELK
jgi:hypothetical protein